ncbi:MAG: methyltransferase domain-containing protein [Acidobacteriota bacterium]|nr:methyltransferase domain-containing protein [Acidobacteriota bacterium]
MASPQIKPEIDSEVMMSFAHKVVGDLAAAMSGPLLYIGDRLGLFKKLAEVGSATVAGLSQEMGLQERYVREWASAMVAAEYLKYDPLTGMISLPPEHAMVLANEESPVFTGGLSQMIPDQYRVMPRVMEAFKRGGGVPYSDFAEDTFVGTERLFRPGYINFLAQQWLASMPDIMNKLEAGAVVADVGCGRGAALLQVAARVPNSRFTGYDNYAPGIEYANENARKHGLSGRLSYEVRNSASLPQTAEFDLVMTLDCLHDMVDPEGCARSIRGALKPDGTWFVIEPNMADKLEQNINPIGRLFYSVSTLQCMTCSLAYSGAGYGAGMGPANVRKVAESAGFKHFRKLPIENPFNQFFEIKAS